MKNLKKALAVSCAGLLLFAPYNYPVFPEILTAYAVDEKDVSTGDITIDTDGEYSISGETTEHKIIISESCTVTLTGVKINLSSGSPIAIAEGKTVTLILSGGNTLSSGDSSAIVVNSGAKLIIQVAEGTSETGTLNATGSESSTDIGGEGTIEIQSGTVNATITSGGVEIKDGAIVNGCTYPPSYTITIPQSIDFRTDRSAKVSLADVNIEDDKKISVKLSSENAVGGAFYLKNGSNKIEYTVNAFVGSSYYSSVIVDPNDEILEATLGEGTPGKSGSSSTDLTFTPKTEQIKYAGSYTDTLTFTVSMENK